MQLGQNKRPIKNKLELVVETSVLGGLVSHVPLLIDSKHTNSETMASTCVLGNIVCFCTLLFESKPNRRNWLYTSIHALPIIQGPSWSLSYGSCEFESWRVGGFLRVFSTNETDCHVIAEILLKVVLNTITLIPNPIIWDTKNYSLYMKIRY